MYSNISEQVNALDIGILGEWLCLCKLLVILNLKIK